MKTILPIKYDKQSTGKKVKKRILRKSACTIFSSNTRITYPYLIFGTEEASIIYVSEAPPSLILTKVTQRLKDIDRISLWDRKCKALIFPTQEEAVEMYEELIPHYLREDLKDLVN